MTELTNADLLTAIVTPFTDEGTIDYPALDQLTEHLLQAGNNGFVVGGQPGRRQPCPTTKRLNSTPTSVG